MKLGYHSLTLLLALTHSLCLYPEQEQAPEKTDAYISQRGKRAVEFSSEQSTNKSADEDLYKLIFEKGNKLLQGQKIDDAIDCYKRTIAIHPANPQAYFNMGIAYERNNKFSDAIASFKRAIEYRPAYSKAHYHLGKVLEKSKQYDQALNSLSLAVKHDPTMFDAYVCMGRIESGREKFTQAAAHLKRAHEIHPNNKLIGFELANALNTINRTEEALELYYALLEKDPNDSAILYNTAYTLKKLGKLREAMPFYRATLERNPNHCEAHFSLGLAHLIGGDFEKGWLEYEWRWKRDKQLTPRNYQQPVWDGSDLHGKTILLHAEQGLGDTLQFIRYAQVVKELYNARVIAVVQKPLVTLIDYCPYIDHVATFQDKLPPFDVQAPLMSLPYILNTTEKTVPKTVPYLFARKELINHWDERLRDDKNFKIGICWQGNSNYSTPFLRSVVAAKSVSLKNFTPISALPGVSVYSIQKQTGTDQLDGIPQEFNLYTFEGDFDQSSGRFMDTAAVIKNLDLVITVDTGIAHLAGGLGVPTWILTPKPPDWRWMLERTDTPWYPNVRLFRQETPGDWEGVIEKIVTELAHYIQQKKKAHQSHTMAQPEKQSSLSQLEKELESVNAQLFALVEVIQTSKKPIALDEELMSNMKTFHLLAEIRNTVRDKINALQKTA